MPFLNVADCGFDAFFAYDVAGNGPFGAVIALRVAYSPVLCWELKVKLKAFFVEMM